MKNKYGFIAKLSRLFSGLFVAISGIYFFLGPAMAFASPVPLVTSVASGGQVTTTFDCSTNYYGEVDIIYHGNYGNGVGGIQDYCNNLNTFANINVNDYLNGDGTLIMKYWIHSGFHLSSDNDEDFFYTLSETGFAPSVTSYPPAPFYAEIKNTPSGAWNLRDASSTSSNILKTLPQDWIVYVASTTDVSGKALIANEYRWYQVTDPTDGISGWMAGTDASNTVDYLPYNSSKQTDFEATSSDFVSISSTPDLILNVINNYYSTSTGDSLYDQDTSIAHLNDSSGYPQQIVPGIIESEDGGVYGLNNDIISSDYGHGLMQITLDPGYPFDNRGIASDVTIPPCSLASSLYTNCYTSPDSGNHNERYYEAYVADPSQGTYKQYASTTQSIYANIKDGLHILGSKYNAYSGIVTSTTTDGTTFSANDRKVILATENYNGDNDVACGYVDTVATNLDNITSYFPNATTSAITSLLPKMHTAGGDVICAQLHSPADISIQDSEGRLVGVTNGEGKNTFPLAIYDKTTKFAEVLAANDDNYSYRVEGTGTGTYELDITMKHNGQQPLQFKATGIPVTPGQVHTYTINKQAFFNGQNNAVTVKVDTNGDGVVDKIITSGPNLTGTAFTENQSMSQ